MFQSMFRCFLLTDTEGFGYDVRVESFDITSGVAPMASKTDRTEADNATEGEIKRTKHRSPNYPMIGLRKAVERTHALNQKYKRATVPINLAQELWGYKAHSGSGNQCVAALRAYGLVHVEGDGKARRLRISDAGYRIALNSTDRQTLLERAALAPPLHAELWNKFKDEGIPDDELLRHYLVLDREEAKFNPETVDDFIADFRDTLSFAGLARDGIIHVQSDSGSKPRPLKVGDLVQWTGGGGDQFAEPQPVMGISDDGQWAFVPGATAGVSVGELTVMNSAKDADPAKPSATTSPPPNPFAGSVPRQTVVFGQPSTKMRELPVTLPTSLEVAVFRVPVPMTETDFTTLVNSLTAMKATLVATSKSAPEAE
jgi:hypothetical protein